MQATVNDFLQKMDQLAPFETAEAYDNVGLILGRKEKLTSRVLVALDATMEVVREAQSIQADLIITHHPLLFHARKKLAEHDSEAKVICEMIRSDIALISAHTNLDQTIFSGSAACAHLLKLQNIRQEGLLFIGECEAIRASELRDDIAAKISPNVRIFGDEDKMVRSVAVCGGAYDEGWQEAEALGADAYITGEVRHHNAIAAVMAGMVMFDAGHFETEAALIKPLCVYLQNWINDVQYDVKVFASKVHPYGRG